MNSEKVCVYIPVEEYRELVQAKRDAECLKAVLVDAVKRYGGLKQEAVEMLCTMFGLKEEEKQQEEKDEW